MASRTSQHVPAPDDIRRALQKIIESPTLAQSLRQRKLLEYLCNKTLLGESQQLKAVTIAVEVFGRKCDFDETKDAIVRVEAHRLRKKLARYYENEGALDPVEIRIPTGRYVPEFVDRAPAEGVTVEPLPASEPTAPAGGGRRADYVVRRFALAAAVLVLAAATGFMVHLRDTRVTAAGSVTRAREAPAQPAGPVVHILAGLAGGTYVDRFGTTWSADRYYKGGTAQPGARNLFPKPPDAGLFATMRTGEFSYDIPVPPGVYELYLYWAEPLFRENNDGGENERRFHVFLNGKPLLRAFDVVTDSGISSTDVRAFKDVEPDRDGRVHIRFAADYGNPFVDALALIPSARGRALPVRMRAHELSFTDHGGNRWTADNYFVGGRLGVNNNQVDGTPDPELYAGERYGHFSYVIPVPSGRYAVTLYLAETWFRPDGPGADRGSEGSRVFDVYCNGTTLLKDLDLLKTAGFLHAYTRTFHRIRPNGQGKIVLTFSPSQNYATVKAIEITDES